LSATGAGGAVWRDLNPHGDEGGDEGCKNGEDRQLVRIGDGFSASFVLGPVPLGRMQRIQRNFMIFAADYPST
jgi:hypothetical protein